MNSKITLESTSKQGALLEKAPDRSVIYTTQITVKEGWWRKKEPIIFGFYGAVCSFMFGGKSYEHKRNIKEICRQSTPYHTFKQFTIRIKHTFESNADKDNFIKELMED